MLSPPYARLRARAERERNTAATSEISSIPRRITGKKPVFGRFVMLRR